MSAHVQGKYTDGILIGGWHVSKRDFGILLNTESGLRSQVYERTVEGKIEFTYATCGTVDLKDWGQNALQLVGASKEYSESASNAKILQAKLGGAELTFTGQSQGGGEAALNALVTDNNAITFNAAGVSDFTKVFVGGLLLPLKSESKITAVIMLTDPLNFAQKNLGLPVANSNRTTIYPTDIDSVIDGHDQGNVCKSYGIDANKYLKPEAKK